MSIVKMKKLRVIAPASSKEELLRELLLLGCVELREQDTLLADPQTAALVSREYGDVTAARTERQVFENAIRILDAYAPVKTPLLSPKPQISEQALLDESRETELYLAAKNLAELEERMRTLDAEAAKMRLSAESFRPWKDCGAPLDYAGTKHVAAEFGTVPAGTDMDAFSAALMEKADASELLEVSADDDARYLMAFFLRSEEDSVRPVLRAFGFAPPAYGTATGFAPDCIAYAEKRCREIGTERIAVEAKIAETTKYREDFRVCYDRAETKVDRAECQGKLLATKSAVLLEGWAVTEQEQTLTELLERLECAYEFEEPEKEEYPDVPVKLKNNKLTDGLNMVTDMYSLPRYGSVDPNPLMAPFFILFFGIMMADMGYGLIMVLAGLLILRKKKPEAGFMKYFGELMIEGGAATFIMGIFTGGFFGDALKWIVQLVNPASTWEGLPALIDPLNDTVTVLIGAIILGFIHLNVGMVISFVMKKRDGRLADAIWNEGAMWLIFLTAGLTVLGLGKFLDFPVLLVIALVLYCYGKTRDAKGFGKIISIFSGIYSDATGWFGDLLSYSRLMALMLAGSVIAQVFNTLGAMPGNIIVFFIISILGNALNFGLNLLGCYVHDLRLQCLEFFNKFYDAGGRAFSPLAIRSKYHRVTK